ncbi:hypothetical protein TWF696_006256 [Orbilia brochopaga]|uniref:Uncharacterized protein n=1 Tax=Orbilia brochopaga TaxID=3140254 RepID=A0AAV9UWK7_9PEZI
MVIRAEAQSLDMLTTLADNPPLHLRRYPPVPPPHDPNSTSNQHRLKLYVVRVPNSHDIILTPLKPQSCTVTAQDITSCLYYLRVQAVDPHSSTTRPHPAPRAGSLDDTATRPSYPRGSFSGSSTRSEHLVPGAGAGNHHSSLSTTTLTSMAELSSADFEITFIRRDRVTGAQTTVGRIYSNGSGTLDSLPLLPNSFAAQMMAQEALRSKKGRRDRKRLNLEIWTPGYQKFLCKPQSQSRPGEAAPDAAVSSAYLWPTPIPPPPPGVEDLSERPPPPPKDTPKKAMMMNPAMERLAYQSRFTEIYSPDTPTAPHPAFPDGEDSTDADDGIFRRTLHLEGEGFWKSTGKRLSAFGAAAAAAHRRRKSHDQSPSRLPGPPQLKPKHDINEETRAAMQQMGLCSTDSLTSPSSSSTPSSLHDRETKGKGYVFDAPIRGAGTCEFETNSVGRKIRLRLHPPHTMAGSPFGNTSVVKAEPLLLCTISFQPPDTTATSAGASSSADDAHGGNNRHARAAAKLNKLGGKFKAKLHRENSWTEHVEQEAGSGMRSKLGSLLVEGEGMDVLDLVVVSSMGVFWKRYCEWTEDLREGGL